MPKKTSALDMERLKLILELPANSRLHYEIVIFDQVLVFMEKINAMEGKKYLC